MVMINCVVRLRWRLFTLLCVRRSGCWWQGQGGWFNMMLEYCLLSTTYFICSDWQWPIIQLMLEISNPQSPIHVSNWGISHCSLRYENKGNSIFNFFHWRRGQQSLLYFQSFWHPEKRQWDFKISDGSLDCVHSELHSPIEAPIGRRTVWMIVLNYSISLSEFGSTKIVVYVQDVRKKWLRENFLFIHFLGTKLHYTLKYVEVSTAHTLLAAMLKHVTFSFCVMRMLLKVIWSPGLDMQSSQGIHCRKSMLTCTNTTITTTAIVALIFKWWTYFRKYSKAGQIFLMCNKTGKNAERFPISWLEWLALHDM